MDEESAKVHPEAPPAGSRRGGFEVVSSWQVVDEPPTTEAAGAAPGRATRRVAEWVSAAFFVPYAIALVVAARAVRPEIASWLKISGEQAPVIMIAVFLGLAILGGVLSRLLGAGIVRLGAYLPGGRRLRGLAATSMSLHLTCPHCGHSDPGDPGLPGRRVRCPECRAVFQVTDVELKPAIATGVAVRPPSSALSQVRRFAPTALGFVAALVLVGVVLLARNFLGPNARRIPDAAPPAVGRLGSQAQPQAARVSPMPPEASRPARAVVIDLGKRASALVEVTGPDDQITGSAFCIDRSGLFVTNAHVVEDLVEGKGGVRLVLDIGLSTQRQVEAKVRRADDYLDLALLEVPADPGLETLGLGDDRTLSETAPVLAFGFPLGQSLQYGREQYPNCTVISGKVTAFHGPRERLEGVQFDGQINEGNSGGPVLDESGRVIGIATATVPGKSINLAVPVGRLREFLDAPGVVFQPSALPYSQRSRAVRWSIKLEPAKPGAVVPDGVTVHVTIAHGKGDRRTAVATHQPDGTYKVEVIPVPRDPGPPVRAIEALVEAKKGAEVLATVHRVIELEGAPGLLAWRAAEPEYYIIRTLPRPPMFSPYGPRIPGFGAPREHVVIVERTPSPSRRPAAPRSVAPRPTPTDNDGLAVKGRLDVSGRPVGAGASIRPPAVPIGEARVEGVMDALHESRRLAGHGDGITDLVVSRDGRRVVTASSDRTVRVWDATTGRPIHVLKGHDGPVLALAISPDGRRALSGGLDAVLRLWDVEAGGLLREYRGHLEPISAIAFTPDGRRALSAGGGSVSRPATDFSIWVRDLDSGDVVSRWLGHHGIVYSLTVSPDGRLALSSSRDASTKLWDVAKGLELKRFNGYKEQELHALFAPDGRSAILTADDHVIEVREVPGDRLRLSLRGHRARVDAMAVSPDGRTLISASGNERALRTWDLRDGRLLQVTPLGDNPRRGGFAADGRRVYWCLSDKTVREYAAPDGRAREGPRIARRGGRPTVLPLEGRIKNVAVGGGGRYLCLKLPGPSVAIFDANAAAVTRTIRLDSEHALIAAGAHSLAVAYPAEPSFATWSLDDPGRPPTKVSSPITEPIKSIAMGSDSDGPLVVAWSLGERERIPGQARFSFLDPRTFAVLKVDSLGLGGFQRIGAVSPTGGSVTLHPSLQGEVHLRASAGGGLLGIWQTPAKPSGFHTLAIEGAALRATMYPGDHDPLVPGPEGRTIYTGRSGIRDIECKAVPGSDPSPIQTVVSIPTADPAYCLTVSGLRDPGTVNREAAPRVEIMVNRTAPMQPLFRVTDLEEIPGGVGDRLVDDYHGDFTVEKRFHLVPAAGLLITIPSEDNRLVLRRLDIEESARETRRDGSEGDAVRAAPSATPR
jgi:S1-C subfamily serine protease